MKYVFIVNPTSASGKAMEIAKKVEKVCKEDKLDYEMRYISKEKDGVEIAQEYKDEECYIYSVGGDGHLFTVLNGIIGTKNILGVIPAGSGNDFQKTLKQLDDGILDVDVGKINDKYFINIVCIGIDAETAYNVEIMKKKVPTKKIYDVSIIYTFIKYKFKKLKFIFNGKEKSGEYTIVTICNGQYYGGGYRIAPHALINDGKFDFYFADRIPKLQIPGLISKAKKGEHEGIPCITKEQTEKLVIESKEEVICCADGEIIKGNKFEIEILPHKVRVNNNQKFVEKILNTNLDEVVSEDKKEAMSN